MQPFNYGDPGPDYDVDEQLVEVPFFCEESIWEDGEECECGTEWNHEITVDVNVSTAIRAMCPACGNANVRHWHHNEEMADEEYARNC